MIRDTSAGGAEDSDAAGQASLAVLGGPMASERLAKGLRTAEQTLKHPQATAAEVAGENGCCAACPYARHVCC